MNRSTIVKFHLVLAGFFLPFFIFVPLSGGLYLAGEKGKFTETLDFTIEEKLPENKPLFEKRVWEIFREQGISYEFEYAKMRGESSADLRPTSEAHYRVRYKNGKTEFIYVEPDIWKSLLELHMGHGPQALKWLQIFFAMGLLMIGFSGTYMAFSGADQKKPLVISAVLGLSLFFLLLNL